MTEDDLEHRKLNAIIGSAVKALALSGADDEFIGAFALSHRIKVAKLLGKTETPRQEPDLQTIVAQAIAQALAAAGVGNAKSKSPARRINVIIAGRRTSVTLGRNTVAQLVEAKGDKQANELINELANSAPTNVANRSRWVTERLKTYLTFGTDNEGSIQRH